MSRHSADSYWDNKGINGPAEVVWHFRSPYRRGEEAMYYERGHVGVEKRECLGGGHGRPVWRWKGEPELCRGQRWGQSFQVEAEQSSKALNKKYTQLQKRSQCPKV